MTAASTTPPGAGSADPDERGPGGSGGTGADGTATASPESSAPWPSPEGPAADPTGGPSTGGPSDPGSADPGSADPGPTGVPPADPPTENRFFLWLRSLDLSRRPGWIGGVCSGIAERLGVDPLIVRGVFVVVAVLGGPAFLFYAAAWLLIPDSDGALPVESFVRGRLDRVHAGIGALVLASMLPVAQGFWSLGGAYTGAFPWGSTGGRALWTAVVVGLIIWFVVWVARRSGRPEEAPEAPATAGAQPDSAPLLPPQRPTDTRPESPEDIAAWRERQEQWKAEREAFRAQQAAGARETARIRAEESRARAQAITAARLERQRAHRAANPRLRPSATLLALGAAAVTGALASLTASGSTAVVVGFAVAALVLGLVIVVAGVLRRRASLLVTVSVVAVLTAGTATLLPPDRVLLPTYSSYSLSNAVPGDYAMLSGTLDVTIAPELGEPGDTIDIWQGEGEVRITPLAGTALRLDASSSNGDMWVVTDEEWAAADEQRFVDGSWTWSRTFGDPDAIPVTVRIAQGSGSIVVDDSALQTTDTTEAGR